VQASAQTDIRQQISAFVQSDIYSRYLQGAVFVGVLAAGDHHCCVHHHHCLGLARLLEVTSVLALPSYLQCSIIPTVCATAVDAAYSGDWARIHAIEPATEAWLKQTLPLLGGFHIFCAAVSGITANRAGRPWQWPTIKAALVGGLAMFEQLLQVDE
jgi:hypothetical protein